MIRYKARILSFLLLLFKTVLAVLTKAVRQEKEIKDTYLRKEYKTIFVYRKHNHLDEKSKRFDIIIPRTNNCRIQEVHKI